MKKSSVTDAILSAVGVAWHHLLSLARFLVDCGGGIATDYTESTNSKRESRTDACLFFTLVSSCSFSPFGFPI